VNGFMFLLEISSFFTLSSFSSSPPPFSHHPPPPAPWAALSKKDKHLPGWL
jgi:hypothetical protein